jgi:hypothetical protein
MYPSGVTCLSENSWLRIRIVCLCEATCVPTDYYYSDPGLCEATCVPTGMLTITSQMLLYSILEDIGMC